VLAAGLAWLTLKYREEHPTASMPLNQGSLGLVNLLISKRLFKVP
jgi:hypothetical protein